jgi:soluble lytic murein transglycosylase-like protein
LIREWREGDHAEISREEAGEYAKAIFEASQETGVDPYVLTAMAFVESRFIRTRVSAVGAVGAWQQLPRYSGVFGDGCWEGPHMICRVYADVSPVDNLTDPYVGARVAARHLTYLYNRYEDSSLTPHENMRNALAHYNGGNNPARECWTRYADTILARL